MCEVHVGCAKYMYVIICVVFLCVYVSTAGLLKCCFLRLCRGTKSLQQWCDVRLHVCMCVYMYLCMYACMYIVSTAMV
jgi:hypothetical protein